MNGADPESLIRSNPRLNEFVAANMGKPPEQICREYGIDSSVLQLIGSMFG